MKLDLGSKDAWFSIHLLDWRTKKVATMHTDTWQPEDEPQGARSSANDQGQLTSHEQGSSPQWAVQSLLVLQTVTALADRPQFLCIELGTIKVLGHQVWGHLSHSSG